MYKLKYVPQTVKNGPSDKQGRYSKPETWITGPDPVRHDKYYAWLKHRAQAKYRGEEYSITWEQWETLWTDDLFLQRGRRSDSMCLTRFNFEGEWCVDNVHIVTRLEHLKSKTKDKQDSDV